MPEQRTSEVVVMTWARLFHGRLWHVQQSPDQTWCGEVLVSIDERRVERIDNAPPGGAWICDRCVREIRRLADDARAAWLLDPRRQDTDQLPEASEPVPEPEVASTPEVELLERLSESAGPSAKEKAAAAAEIAERLREAAAEALAARDANPEPITRLDLAPAVEGASA
ncbi:hypothetical protein ATK74_0827 [Propionicimonas paludicola]|uniref:Uncharacterized protein n=1 Tax=Propionicimonas paludicola TaxID=185243 RepID=A0A2A9CPH1_9ACTN|nr:hypothetical protein [Propionicimonas paludicola]PFG16293.1 hypothetical protein ATK74_0827 [Propionicimonas paludicola]